MATRATRFRFTDSEWGISPGSFEQRGLISALEILGGPGVDQLYGGAEDDYIDGGEDQDFVYGLQGDDSLCGGSGDDLIVGDDEAPVAAKAVRPDRYETVTRGDRTGVNDDVQFAALLENLEPGSVIEGLSFHRGDAEDWYILPAPSHVR